MVGDSNGSDEQDLEGGNDHENDEQDSEEGDDHENENDEQDLREEDEQLTARSDEVVSEETTIQDLVKCLPQLQQLNIHHRGVLRRGVD